MNVFLLLFAHFDPMVLLKKKIHHDYTDLFIWTIINNHVNSLDYFVHNSLLWYFAHVESYILNRDRLDNRGNKYWNGKKKNTT